MSDGTAVMLGCIAIWTVTFIVWFAVGYLAGRMLR